MNEVDYPEFPKTIYGELDEFGETTLTFADLNNAERGGFVAVYELKSVGIADTKLTKVKAVSK